MSRLPAPSSPPLFETPAAETFFKALLWVVVILQAILLGRQYNRLNHPQQQHHARTVHHPSR